jgi:signal peptidase I
VVFNREDDPTTHIDESARTMVKRVIGLPGDRVAVRGAQVFVNGEPLAEPYARWQRGGVSEEQNFTVPDNALFMLGDNRDESYDSRFWTQPFVRSQRVVGPVAAVYWSQAQARG